MMLYRGTRNILPHKIDHKYLGDGIYGRGTYLALHVSDAQMYAGVGFEDLSVITSYTVDLNNFLTINSSDWEDIKNVSQSENPLKISSLLQEKLDYQNSYLAPVNLSKVVSQGGFEGVVLQGSIEGGEQVLIPQTSALIIVPKSFHVDMSIDYLGYTKDNSHREVFVNKINSSGAKCVINGSRIIINATIEQMRVLKELFTFIEDRCKHQDLYSIDFESLKVEPYDE